uniref:Uncharacterized protein n=1 Tax=Anguilla anguilla TaxID=7936 RepID=A0A0E9XL30_ANGAN
MPYRTTWVTSVRGACQIQGRGNITVNSHNRAYSNLIMEFGKKSNMKNFYHGWMYYTEKPPGAS